MNAPSYRPSPERLREFVATAKRLETERATAEEVVRQLLHATPTAEWPQLAEREELRNSGALERLGCESRDLLEKKPQDALVIAELATTIADSLAEDAYPAVVLAQVRAGAWKDRANALRYVSRHDEAYDAISRAEKTLMRHAALVVDRAVVDLVKAMIVFELNHPDVASELLGRAREAFVATGDLKHLNDADLIEGSVLYSVARYADARKTYAQLLKRTDDAETVARIHNNLGYCAAHLGDFTAANIHFSEAIARFTDLGFRAEAMRTQRGAGTLLAEKGQVAAGLLHLKEARAAFSRFGMIRDAGLCGLRIAEIFLARGDSEGARLATREVAADFAAASFSDEAVRVLAGLERAIADDDASVESIRGVQSFIAEVAEQPAAF